MTQEITTPTDAQPVMMRSGLVHWVSKETADRIQDVLAGQTGHSFVKIRELGITINSADVEGVYTLKEYGDLARVKQGMFQCEYQVWHGKKELCECKQTAARKREAEMRRATDAAENRELSEDELADRRERLRKGSEWTALGDEGFFRSIYTRGARHGKRMRRSTVLEWEARNGPIPNLEDLAIEEDVPSEALEKI